jgi:hypothetical protein
MGLPGISDARRRAVLKPTAKKGGLSGPTTRRPLPRPAPNGKQAGEEQSSGAGQNPTERGQCRSPVFHLGRRNSNERRNADIKDSNLCVPIEHLMHWGFSLAFLVLLSSRSSFFSCSLFLFCHKVRKSQVQNAIYLPMPHQADNDDGFTLVDVEDLDNDDDEECPNTLVHDDSYDDSFDDSLDSYFSQNVPHDEWLSG